MSVLKGIRVLDLSRFQSGVVCGMLLGNIGAEVIRVEEPEGAGDRSWRLQGPDGKTLSYEIVGGSGKGITLRLDTEEGLRIFREPVKHSDVVLHNFTLGSKSVEKLRHDDIKDKYLGVGA